MLKPLHYLLHSESKIKFVRNSETKVFKLFQQILER